LDPNVPNMRENMIQSVTLSLHDLVKKYPNIAFHGHSQRIAIGSIDGLILIYDLKTGTRWQILEVCLIMLYNINKKIENKY